MTTSWPHSSHLLLRPWLTCPPNRKISRLFTNAPRSCTGQNATWTDTYLNFLTCLCSKTAGRNCFVLIKIRGDAFVACKSWAVRRARGCFFFFFCWSLSLNENQLAKLHPVRGTKTEAERAPRDPLATLKHLEHLCCFKFLYFLTSSPWYLARRMNFVCQSNSALCCEYL